jgi:DNA-binding NarL/FixJ family response regulator
MALGNDYALVLDDHPFVASGIANFLSTHCHFKHAVVLSNEESCYHYFRMNGPPKLMVVDFWLSDVTALKLIKEMKLHYPNVRFLVVSGDENNQIWQKVREVGGHGFVLKSESPAIFAQAVFALSENRPWFPLDNVFDVNNARNSLEKYNLTPRQHDVLDMMMRGFPNKKIASRLSISETTVKEHVSNILKKIGVSSRVGVLTLLYGKQERP